MVLTFFFAILYNAETYPMWKIFSVPCGSALYKFHCSTIITTTKTITTIAILITVTLLLLLLLLLLSIV
jgi:hypothetical protein